MKSPRFAFVAGFLVALLIGIGACAVDRKIHPRSPSVMEEVSRMSDHDVLRMQDRLRSMSNSAHYTSVVAASARADLALAAYGRLSDEKEMQRLCATVFARFLIKADISEWQSDLMLIEPMLNRQRGQIAELRKTHPELDLLIQKNLANQAAEPSRTPGTAPADAGARASGAPGSP
jgi:hypothetical protein